MWNDPFHSTPYPVALSHANGLPVTSFQQPPPATRLQGFPTSRAGSPEDVEVSFYTAPRSQLSSPAFLNERPSSGRMTSPEDAEVSFYNNTACVDSTWPVTFDHCCSTDTSVSGSSCSTVASLTSIDGCNGNTKSNATKQRRGTKRKRDSGYKRYPKPPYSYTGMIVYAIMTSEEKHLSLKGIQKKLMEFFPFFRGEYQGWRDSVRHNLSASKCFTRTPVPHMIVKNKSSIGTRFFWGVDMTMLNASMFRRQNFVGELSEFKEWLHDELGLPPLPINLHADATIDVDAYPCPEDTSSQTSRWANYAPDTGKFSMRVSQMTEQCLLPDDSPLVSRRRDSLGDGRKAFEDVTPIKQEIFRESPVVTTPLDDIYVFMNYIAEHHCDNPQSDVSAVDNLSFLCSTIDPPTLKEPSQRHLSPFSIDAILNGTTTSVKPEPVWSAPAGTTHCRSPTPPHASSRLTPWKPSPELPQLTSSAFLMGRYLRPISPVAVEKTLLDLV